MHSFVRIGILLVSLIWPLSRTQNVCDYKFDGICESIYRIPFADDAFSQYKIVMNRMLPSAEDQLLDQSSFRLKVFFDRIVGETSRELHCSINSTEFALASSPEPITNAKLHLVNSIHVLDNLFSSMFTTSRYNRVLFVTLEETFLTPGVFLKCGKLYTCNFKLYSILLQRACLQNEKCTRDFLETWLKEFEFIAPQDTTRNNISAILAENNLAVQKNVLIFIYARTAEIAIIYDIILNKLELSNSFIQQFEFLYFNEEDDSIHHHTFDRFGLDIVIIDRFSRIEMVLQAYDIIDNMYWSGGTNHTIIVNCAKQEYNVITQPTEAESESSANLIALAVQEKPFIYINDKGQWEGFCVDLLNILASTYNMNITVKEANEKKFGDIIDANYNNKSFYAWNGAMGQLMNNEGQLIAGKFLIDSMKDNFIDFTLPYYHMGGIGIITKKPVKVSNMFLFVVVFKPELWLGVFGVITVVAFLIYLLDQSRPLNRLEEEMQNSDKNVHWDFKQYNLLDSFWITFGAFTMAGGVHPPKALSIKTILAAFWLFSAVTVSTYSANLSAFLTVSSISNDVGSIKSLAQQVTFKYTAINNSETKIFFDEFKTLEDKLLRLYRNVSFSQQPPTDSTGLKAYAVWDYPLTDVFSRLWAEMDGGDSWAKSLDDGIARVLAAEGDFGLIADYPTAKYAESQLCTISVTIDRLSPKSYGFGFRKNSMYTSKFSEKIIKMEETGELNELVAKWWPDCNDPPPDESISLSTFGGTFIMMGGALVVTIFLQFMESSLKRKRCRQRDEDHLRDLIMANNKSATMQGPAITAIEM